MDELSWRARLLKSNINITRIDYKYGVLYIDFAYRPRPGSPQKWGKTIFDLVQYEDMVGTRMVDWYETTSKVLTYVLNLRKELEA